ncbi:MAG: hypothetical protein L6R42_010433, partial [Xanthoria sp. 1 TBL-2021]
MPFAMEMARKPRKKARSAATSMPSTMPFFILDDLKRTKWFQMSDSPSWDPQSESAHRWDSVESNIAYGQERKAGHIDHGTLFSLGGRIDDGDCVQGNTDSCSADCDFSKHQLDPIV